MLYNGALILCYTAEEKFKDAKGSVAAGPITGNSLFYGEDLARLHVYHTESNALLPPALPLIYLTRLILEIERSWCF